MPPRKELETRDVRSDDPSLTPEANRVVTVVARRAVGSEMFWRPRGTPRGFFPFVRAPPGKQTGVGFLFPFTEKTPPTPFSPLDGF